jgi:hypothetical protein
MKLRLPTPEDFDYVREHSISRGIKEQYYGTVDYDCACEHEGILLGVGGIKLLTPYSALCWMDWTEDARDHKIAGYRLVKEWLDDLMAKLELVCVIAYVRANFMEGRRTVEHLGFDQNGVVPYVFGPAESAIEYVKIAKHALVEH